MALFNKMLEDLNASRQLMSEQVHLMDDILKKSNNIMLAAEISHSLNPPADAKLKPFTVRKETKGDLLKIVDSYLDAPKHSPDEEENTEYHQFHSKLLEYTQSKRESVKHLQVNIRKFIAARTASYGVVSDLESFKKESPN